MKNPNNTWKSSKFNLDLCNPFFLAMSPKFEKEVAKFKDTEKCLVDLNKFNVIQHKSDHA